MASVYKRKNGRYEIAVVIGNKRHKIQAETGSKKPAITILNMVEGLAYSKKTSTVPDHNVADWVASLPSDSKIFRRLLKLQLVKPRLNSDDKEKDLSIKELVDQFLDIQRKKLKATSIKKADDSLAKLVDFFGTRKLVREITVGDARRFDSHGHAKHSEAHQRTLNRYAKQVFQYALDHKWIESNPFNKVKTSALAGTRDRFVDSEQIESIIKQCKNPDLKLVIALARYAGLRVPSEVQTLTWSDVRLDEKPPTIQIAHHKTKARKVPILPELKVLLDARKPAEGGSKVIMGSCANLRREFASLLDAIKVKPWPKLFQTLRQSCENDLVRRGVNASTVAKWMGHSVKVAQEHFMMETDDDYLTATRPAQNGR